MNPTAQLATLNRPQLLVRAARIGLAEFNRERTLKRIFQGETHPSPGRAFEALLTREDAMDCLRREGGAAYSPAKHVELLTALISEARLAEFRKAA